MLEIKEISNVVAISERNIRYYEEMGLITPKRKEINNYRLYDEDDVKTLKTIKLLRSLDLSIAEIKALITKKKNLKEVINNHQKHLVKQKANLDLLLNYCDHLKEQDLNSMNVDLELEKINKAPEGSFFKAYLDDYKQIIKKGNMDEFTFTPDIWIKTKEDFTRALVVFAEEHKLPFEMVCEGMYPLFYLDDILYKGERIVVPMRVPVCQIVCKREGINPDLIEINKKHQKVINFLRHYSILIPLLVLDIIMIIPLFKGVPLWAGFVCLLVVFGIEFLVVFLHNLAHYNEIQ